MVTGAVGVGQPARGPARPEGVGAASRFGDESANWQRLSLSTHRRSQTISRMNDEVRVRQAVISDVTRLAALNARAYPDLVTDGVVFDASQLAAQQAVFAEGQIVVERAGVIEGAIATLVVRSEAALVPHTWAGITSHGTFAGHDASGDVLYLADVYVDPTAHGRGLGAKLYATLFQLCERKRLARVVGGGRLWGYHEVKDAMTPDAYVAEVIAGRRRDRVLGSQLKAGFAVRGVMPGYLDDWRSASFATLLDWEASAARSPRRQPLRAERGWLPGRAAGEGP